MRSTYLSFVPGLQGASAASPLIAIDRARRHVGFSYRSRRQSPAYATPYGLTRCAR